MARLYPYTCYRIRSLGLAINRRSQHLGVQNSHELILGDELPPETTFLLLINDSETYIYTGELKIDGIIIHKAKFVVDLFHLCFKTASEYVRFNYQITHIHRINTHMPTHTHITSHTHTHTHIYIFFIQPNFILVASTVLRSAPLFLCHRETNSSNIVVRIYFF